MQPEDEYLDVLQNIEAAIVAFYRDHPELTDYQVDAAFEALIRTYQREKIGGQAVLPKGSLAQDVYRSIKMTCDWRLGRENVVDEEGQPLGVEPLTIDEIQACLKRLRKSLATWNKRSGTQGYLNYIRQFIV